MKTSVNCSSTLSVLCWKFYVFKKLSMLSSIFWAKDRLIVWYFKWAIIVMYCSSSCAVQYFDTRWGNETEDRADETLLLGFFREYVQRGRHVITHRSSAGIRFFANGRRRRRRRTRRRRKRKLVHRNSKSRQNFSFCWNNSLVFLRYMICTSNQTGIIDFYGSYWLESELEEMFFCLFYFARLKKCFKHAEMSHGK